MDPWNWLNQSSALLSIATLLVVFTGLSIAVLAVTWKAIERGAIASEAQTEAIRALTISAQEQTEVARQQTEAIAKQSIAALQSAIATDEANRISDEANRLTVRQIQVDLRPVLVYAVNGFAFHQVQDVIRNIGRGPARDVQICTGIAKDELPKEYIESRAFIASGDEVNISINPTVFLTTGMRIHYASLDGRHFVTSVYGRDKSIKQDFQELDC